MTCLWKRLIIDHFFGLKKVAHTRLPSVGFRSWSRFLAVNLQLTWIINPTVGCRYFPPGLQLPLRGLLLILLLGEQRHSECEQFAQYCYPTASRLRFEPRPFCAWVQHANHSATEPPLYWSRNRKAGCSSCVYIWHEITFDLLSLLALSTKIKVKVNGHKMKNRSR